MAAGGGAGGRRKKSEETRSRIIEAGREAFAAKGFHDTRVSEIIARTGLGHGTFWLYFRDKEDLLRTLVEEMLRRYVDENLADRLAPGRADAGGLAGIEEVVSGVVRVFEDNRALHQAILEAAMRSEEFAGVFDRINQELARDLRSHFSFLLPGGLGADPEQVSLLLVLTIACGSLMWAKGFMHCTREEYVRNLSALLFSFVGCGGAAG